MNWMMRIRGEERKHRRERRRRPPTPDLTGWTAGQILVWASRNGRYEEIVALANHGHQPRMVSAEEHEAQLRAAGQWAAETASAPTAPAVEQPPAAPAAEPEAPRAYWEEKCQWRLRGPEDYDWGDESDPVEDEYDPFADERLELS